MPAAEWPEDEPMPEACKAVNETQWQGSWDWPNDDKWNGSWK